MEGRPHSIAEHTYFEHISLTDMLGLLANLNFMWWTWVSYTISLPSVEAPGVISVRHEAQSS